VSMRKQEWPNHVIFMEFTPGCLTGLQKRQGVDNCGSRD